MARDAEVHHDGNQASLSRSFVCARLELDPKMRASMICSSGLVKRIRMFFTKNPPSHQVLTFRVLSLYLESRKLHFGNGSFSNRVQ